MFEANTQRTFLSSLLQDRTANTLVIMAAALVPLTAFAGSVVDMGRLYLVKTRLQQACDAGVLAGRKFMDASGSSTLDPKATANAKAFFKNNFQAGWVNTVNPDFKPVKTADQQVAGTATVTVPMTVTKIINASDRTVSVACEARYDIADTDIVFVLDTTGSMACRPEDTEAQCNAYVNANPATAYARPSDSYGMPGYSAQQGFGVPETLVGTGSRMKALRQAVKDFYAVVDSSIDPSTRVRYGFVSYTSVINAGKAISSVNPAYLVGNVGGETVNYQTRVVTGEYDVSKSYAPQSNNRSETACKSAAPYSRDPVRPASGAFTFRTTDGKATVNTWEWRTNIYPAACYDVSKLTGPVWTYGEYPIDVSQYVKGQTVDDPARVDSATSAWDGCIEERKTQSGTTSFNSNAYDLDPLLIPSSNVDTRWRPSWAAITWSRYSYYSTATQNSNDEDFRPYPYGSQLPGLNMGDDTRRKSGFYSCGKPIRRLMKMSSSDISGYVDAADFKPVGGTYHDTGMIWGVRLLAADGIFAADNVGRAGQPKPKKIIVFLTDGDMAPSPNIYGLYGTEYYDQRVSGGSSTPLKDFHNARFLYECNQATQLKIDVWTVAIAPSTTTELKQCASNEGQALYTTTGAGLASLFQKIAKQVAMLRLQS
jgi:Flp pilus assembly protein TadG